MDFSFQHVVDAIGFLTTELSILVNPQNDNYVAKIEKLISILSLKIIRIINLLMRSLII